MVKTAQRERNRDTSLTVSRPLLAKRPHEPRSSPSRRRPSPADLPTTLVSRRDTSRILGGISTTTLIRMETAGTLKPIKPSGMENGKTYYALAQVVALTEGTEDEAGSE
jgi:hypothetical protein